MRKPRNQIAGPSSGPVAPATATKTSDFIVDLGSTGLRRSGDYLLADFIPQLNGQKGAQAYFEMGENDPLLGGFLFTIEMLMRRVAWEINPPEDVSDDDAAKEAAALVRRMLMTELDRPFPDVIADLASAFQYGYAILEIVYRIGDDGTLTLKSLDPRAQTSITRWDFDPVTGKWRGCWQQDISLARVGEVYIPRTKLAHFAVSPRSDNPEGRSLLRHAYTTYKRNQVLLEAEGRAAVRAAGFVLCKVPNALMRKDAGPDEKQRFQNILRVVENVAADRQGAVILPGDVDPETKMPLYDITYVVADGQRSADMSPLIERGDVRMMASVLADFLLLGQNGGGSLALSADKTDLFETAVQGFVDSIAAMFNRQVIAPLWKRRGGDPALTPIMSGGEVSKTDIAALASFATALISAGALTPDDPLEAFLRKAGKLPKADPTTARKAVPAGGDEPLTGRVEGTPTPRKRRKAGAVSTTGRNGAQGATAESRGAERAADDAENGRRTGGDT